jgi:hypothetical protein
MGEGYEFPGGGHFRTLKSGLIVFANDDGSLSFTRNVKKPFVFTLTPDEFEELMEELILSEDEITDHIIEFDL